MNEHGDRGFENGSVRCCQTIVSISIHHDTNLMCSLIWTLQQCACRVFEKYGDHLQTYQIQSEVLRYCPLIPWSKSF